MSDSRFARSAGSFRSFPVLGLVAMATVAGACNAKPGSGPAPSADAWAVVDGREIKRDDVEKAYRRAMQAQGAPSEEEALNAKLNLLNEMIVQDILIAKAGSLKIEVPDNATPETPWRITRQSRWPFYRPERTGTDLQHPGRIRWHQHIDPAAELDSDIRAVADKVVSVTPLSIDLTSRLPLDDLRIWLGR